MKHFVEEKPHKKPVSMVKAVTKVDDGPSFQEDQKELNLEASGNEELSVINAIQFQQVKPPFRWGGFSFTPATSARPIKCWYCKKMGHMQKECKSRLRDGAPKVDSSTTDKPGGQPNRVHTVKKVEGHVSSLAAAAVHSVQEMRSDNLNAVDHLNWS